MSALRQKRSFCLPVLWKVGFRRFRSWRAEIRQALQRLSGAAIGPEAMPVSKLYPRLCGPTQPAHSVGDWEVADVGDWEVAAIEVVLAAIFAPPPPPLEQAETAVAISKAMTWTESVVRDFEVLILFSLSKTLTKEDSARIDSVDLIPAPGTSLSGPPRQFRVRIPLHR